MEKPFKMSVSSLDLYVWSDDESLELVLKSIHSMTISEKESIYHLSWGLYEFTEFTLGVCHSRRSGMCHFQSKVFKSWSLTLWISSLAVASGRHMLNHKIERS